MAYKTKEGRQAWLGRNPNYERDRSRRLRELGKKKTWDWKNKPENYHADYHKAHSKEALERANKLRAKKYGLTWEQWQVLDAQRRIGLCEICGGEPSRKERGTCNRVLHMDHDHKTGKFRGLLCHRCNTGLGGFRDSPDTLAAAISYLREKGGAA